MWPTRIVECSSCTLTLAQVIRPLKHDHLGLSQVSSRPQTPFGTLNFLFVVALAARGKFVFLEPQLLVNSWEAICYKGGT